MPGEHILVVDDEPAIQTALRGGADCAAGPLVRCVRRLIATISATGAKKAKVTINLPINLVRALGGGA